MRRKKRRKEMIYRMMRNEAFSLLDKITDNDKVILF